MASTGPAVVTSTTAVTSTSTVTGQGLYPLVRCYLSFDDVSDSTPTWTDVSADLRSFSISRGRGSELDEFDAGSATVVLDNRDRAYDPNVSTSVRPLNRLWLYSEFTGEVHDQFKGYVDTWDMDWPNGGWSDAEATAHALDEFSVLSMMALPTTSPPRESYEDLVMSDAPTGYWDMGEDPVKRQHLATVVEEQKDQQLRPWNAPMFKIRRTNRRTNLLRKHRKR